MATYRDRLPTLSDRVFLMDGGMETTLIFLDGLELPYFASFTLMGTEAGRAHIRAYYARFAELACTHGTGLVLDAPTWRASADWGEKLGYDAAGLAAINRDSIALLAELRDQYQTADSPVMVSGVVGPRGDGYLPGRTMSADDAQRYHAAQIETFAATQADAVSAYTLNYVEEAIGVARAAKAADLPSIISFTLETDGRLPTGQSLREAIEQVDRETGAAPAYFMLNCAHPTHFSHLFAEGGDWLDRVRGVRANASARTHAELDAAPDLDAGDPVELGRQYREMRGKLMNLNVLGGCCGTDYRHVEQICLACLPVA